MYKMHFHSAVLAIYLVFASPMKMELTEVIVRVVDSNIVVLIPCWHAHFQIILIMGFGIRFISGSAT